MHLLFSDRYGGAEKVAIDLIKVNDKQVDSLYVSLNGEIKKNLIDENIDFVLEEKINFFTIKNIIRNYDIDIIHAHDFRASILASFFSKECKIISHIHQSPYWFSKKNKKTFLYLSRIQKYNKIIVVSKEIQEMFPFRVSEKFEVIENIVDTPRVKASSNVYDIIFVGRLEYEKGPLEFLDFISYYKNKTNTNLKVAVVGEGSLKKNLEEYVKSHDLDVEFTGFISSPYKIMALSKFLMVTSVKEGFGIAIVESMQQGTPVITKRIGGVTNLLSKNNSIIYDDYEDLFCKLKQLDKEKYISLCKNSISFADKYRFKNNDIKEIYDDTKK